MTCRFTIWVSPAKIHVGATRRTRGRSRHTQPSASVTASGNQRQSASPNTDSTAAINRSQIGWRPWTATKRATGASTKAIASTVSAANASPARSNHGGPKRPVTSRR